LGERGDREGEIITFVIWLFIDSRLAEEGMHAKTTDRFASRCGLN
jgi:hypothetical protein